MLHNVLATPPALIAYMHTVHYCCTGINSCDSQVNHENEHPTLVKNDVYTDLLSVEQL